MQENFEYKFHQQMAKCQVGTSSSASKDNIFEVVDHLKRGIPM